jgi:endonuclease/exonuclease/phosphatase family metal-dependent hydrolase
MKIGTYNLHYGGDGGVPSHWGALVERADLDLFFAQESHRPAQYGAAYEERAIWAAVPERRWGSAVYSRFHLARRLGLPSFDGWVVGAVCEVPDLGELAVFSIHTPSGRKGSYATLVSQILDEIAELRWIGPMVLAGDFNLVSAGSRLDSEEIQNTQAELGLLRRIADEFGVVNCWRVANAGDPLVQTLRWTRNRATPYHCDAIFIPEQWAVGAVSCEVLTGADWEKMSDHNPLVATVSLEQGISTR